MNWVLIVLLLVVAVLLGMVVAVLILRKSNAPKQGDQALLLLQNRLDSLMKVVDGKLGESQASSLRQFSDSKAFMQDINTEMKKHLSEVTKAVTEANEGSKQVLGVTEELHNLQKILTNQKHRGTLGEASLELILGNILPPGAYHLQFSFSNGDKVDAAIITKDGIIPVDAKFSLDNYNRLVNEADTEKKSEIEKEFVSDLKRRIEETAKYIRPTEGTLPFAMMFIPAEGIYYDLLINEVGAVKSNTRSLIDYAYTDKNVIIVSPTTFAAYLRSVLYGFRAFKIEESARDISKRVEELGKHLKAYEEYYQKLGNALGTTVAHYNSGYKELKKVDKDILKITGASLGVEPIVLDKPGREDAE
ncbi:MAG: DNA recombination protein RmuC [Parcubacteria group bacterium]|nr:DNA recombination protein RmuC [Parcubacteria group bacterium]